MGALFAPRRRLARQPELCPAVVCPGDVSQLVPDRLPLAVSRLCPQPHLAGRLGPGGRRLAAGRAVDLHGLPAERMAPGAQAAATGRRGAAVRLYLGRGAAAVLHRLDPANGQAPERQPGAGQYRPVLRDLHVVQAGQQPHAHGGRDHDRGRVRQPASGPVLQASSKALKTRP